MENVQLKPKYFEWKDVSFLCIVLTLFIQYTCFRENWVQVNLKQMALSNRERWGGRRKVTHDEDIPGLRNVAYDRFTDVQ